MSGMQEFANSLALFVNLDNSTYDNLFAFQASEDALAGDAGAVDAADEDSVGDDQNTSGSGHMARDDDSIATAISKYSRGKLFMTFYAQPRHHADTPIIRRLVDMVQGANQDSEIRNDTDTGRNAGKQTDGDVSPTPSPLESVLLFCRFPNQPYMFWGRIEPIAAFLDVKPIKFIFEIKDLPRLLNTPAFLQLIQNIDIVDLE